MSTAASFSVLPTLVVRAAALVLAAALPAQGLHFATEQNPAGGCFSQAGTIMHLETPPGPCDSGSLLRVTVHDTVPGEHVALCYGDSDPYFGGSRLPLFTHGPYLQAPEYFGPWCGWFTNGGVWSFGVASGTTLTLPVLLPVVPSAAFLGDFLWCQAVMSDPTPGWYQGYVTSQPIRLRVVA